MKRTKLTVLVSLAMAAVMALAGCSSGGSSSVPASQPESKPASSTPASVPEEEKTIVYWAQWSENEDVAGVLKNAIARFEENNPGYQVEVNWAGREVRDILKSSLDSGAQIDIVESGFGNIAALGAEYLQDLTPYMAGSELEASISGGMAGFAKDLAPDGKSWYYVPAQPFVGTFFYNKAIFAQAKIEKMPETWDEFLDCCQKIKDAGYDPITVDDAYQQSMYGHYLAMMKGTEWVTQLLTEKNSELWSDPAVLQMAEDFAELRAKGYLADSVGSNVFPAAQNGEFALGSAAMYYNGSWLPNEVADITGDDFQWGAMFFPAPDGSIYPYTTYTTGCQFYAVTKNCADPEAAFRLLEEFSSVETQTELMEKAAAMPIINGVTLPENLTCVGELMEASTDAFTWGGSSEEDGDIRAIINAAFTDLVSGNTTPEEFVSAIQSQMS